MCVWFFFSSRRRHTRWTGDWSSDVCSSDLAACWSGTYDGDRGGNGRPGAESMTYPTREHEDLLRRALRAAGDSVEPAGDGLERIRARLTRPRPAFAAWMMSGAEPAALRVRPVLSWLRLRIGLALGRIGPALAWLRLRIGLALGRIGPALAWLRARFRAGDGTVKAGPGWLRPVAAIAAFVVIIGSGAFAISALRHSITQTGVEIGLGQSTATTGGTKGPGGVNGNGHKIVPPNQLWLPLHTGSTPAPIRPSPNAQASPGPSCTPTVAPTTTPSPSSTPTPSPSVTPTPTPTPTGTGSPSPSPSDSISPTSGASTAPSALVEAAVLATPAPATAGPTMSTSSPPPPTSTRPC